MSALKALVRVRLWVLIVITVLLAILDGLEPLHPVDLSTLGAAADQLLSGKWLNTFSEERVQVGPLYLLVIGLVKEAARVLDVNTRLVLSIVAQVAVVTVLVACVRLVVGRRDELGALVELGAGASAVAAGLTWTAYISGHMEEAVMAAVWMSCAYAARQGRPGYAGLALAVATGLKLWGLLGIPFLLLLDSNKARLNALAIALGLTAALYGPFFVWGDVATFDYTWPVQSPVLLPLLGSDQSFGWGLRIGQGALTMAAGVGLVLWLRHSAAGAWAIPLGAIAVRIALDPLPHYYFWMPFELLAIVGAAWVIASLAISERVAAAVGAYVVLLGRYLPMLVGYLARLSTAVLLIVLARIHAYGAPSIKSSTNRSDASGWG